MFNVQEICRRSFKNFAFQKIAQICCKFFKIRNFSWKIHEKSNFLLAFHILWESDAPAIPYFQYPWMYSYGDLMSTSRVLPHRADSVTEVYPIISFLREREPVYIDSLKRHESHERVREWYCLVMKIVSSIEKSNFCASAVRAPAVDIATRTFR